MTQALLQMMASGAGGAAPTYVDDVFSAYTYTGNNSSNTITNGINLLVNGGMVWTKNRSISFEPCITDTANGAGYRLQTSTTGHLISFSEQSISAFNSTGYSLNTTGSAAVNGAYSYVSWTFRKAARFFDVVTYTGNGSYMAGANRIPHSLGIAPGFVAIKSTSAIGQWVCFARIDGTNWAIPNASGSSTFGFSNTNSGYSFAANSYFSSTSIDPQSVSYIADVNATGVDYVAYLFAHDTASDGMVQCGSFTTDGSGGATVNHGWSEGVQFALIKCSSTTGDWEMFDTARTSGWTGSDARLRANLSNAEDSVTRLSASGTSVTFAGLSNSATYIYMFIKAP